MKHRHVSCNSLIARTRHVWQLRTGRQLSREDARQISENATGFFAVLAEWSRAERRLPGNDQSQPITAVNKEARHGR